MFLVILLAASTAVILSGIVWLYDRVEQAYMYRARSISQFNDTAQKVLAPYPTFYSRRRSVRARPLFVYKGVKE